MSTFAALIAALEDSNSHADTIIAAGLTDGWLNADAAYHQALRRLPKAEVAALVEEARRYRASMIGCAESNSDGIADWLLAQRSDYLQQEKQTA